MHYTRRNASLTSTCAVTVFSRCVSASCAWAAHADSADECVHLRTIYNTYANWGIFVGYQSHCAAQPTATEREREKKIVRSLVSSACTRNLAAIL